MKRVATSLLSLLVLLPAPLRAQATSPAEPADEGGFKLRISGELKTHLRWSEEDRFPLAFPFPPDFVPEGQPNVALETVSPGTSLEVSRALVNLDVEMPREISGHVQIGFLNLYDRNPTSSDQTVDVREAWIAFGRKRGSLELGKLADLAVLSKDYMTAPVEQIGGIESLLTMVGGRIVYAAGPYAQFEENPRR